MGLDASWLVIAIILLYIFNCIKVLPEYERGVVFRLGRLMPQPKGPGIFLIFPPLDKMMRISLRVETMDVPPQDVVTRDNVTVKVSAVVFFRVIDPNRAVVEVANFVHATSQLAQTRLRAILGEADLDELLSEREKLNARLQAILDELTEAARILSAQPASITLRYLQTLTEIGAEKNTTVVFPLPIDLFEGLKGLASKQNPAA